MALEISVGTPQIAIHAAGGVLLSEQDGAITWPSDKGFYHNDTRLLSLWTIYANGEQWDLLNGGAVTFCTARAYLQNRAFLTMEGEVAARTLALEIGRQIDGGIREDLAVTNYGPRAVCFNLEILVRSDFADIFEVKANRIVRRGRITTEWDAAVPCLTTTYRNQDFERSLRVSAHDHGVVAYANGRITFEVRIAPGERWQAFLTYEPGDGDGFLAAPALPIERCGESRLNTGLEAWRGRVTKLSSSNDGFARLFGQAVDDIGALRLPVTARQDGDAVAAEVGLASRAEDEDPVELVPAAGLPWFVALFGRDSLIVSMQTSMIYPGFARGALELLARYQADAEDDWRDAQPGKILHELRRGELAHFHLVPHTPYYGTADATCLWLITLHQLWMVTGERALLTQHLATAERCLAWIDRHGDLDADGFQEYRTRSKDGLENQSWKDSGDGVLYPDGTKVSDPKALVELQGYAFDAWLRMAAIYDVLGRDADAAALRARAGELRRRFDAAFWDEGIGTYALALDGTKQRVSSVASNPGHCLWSGLVPEHRAAAVVARLMQPDMNSGWGIRTLSSEHRAFNPYSYQNGSVWPHDNGIIAHGLRRYGFDAQAQEVALGVARAGAFFALHQLPELYAGLQRTDTNFPVQYVGANVPQAWAAGAVFSLVTALVGLSPDAPAGVLYVDPALPDWLPDLTLTDVWLGGAWFDLRFERAADGSTGVTVLRGDAARVVRRPLAEARHALARGVA